MRNFYIKKEVDFQKANLSDLFICQDSMFYTLDNKGRMILHYLTEEELDKYTRLNERQAWLIFKWIFSSSKEYIYLQDKYIVFKINPNNEGLQIIDGLVSKIFSSFENALWTFVSPDSYKVFITEQAFEQRLNSALNTAQTPRYFTSKDFSHYAYIETVGLKVYAVDKTGHKTLSSRTVESCFRDYEEISEQKAFFLLDKVKKYIPIQNGLADLFNVEYIKVCQNQCLIRFKNGSYNSGAISQNVINLLVEENCLILDK